MTAARYDFASDNVAGAMPEVMEALVAANAGTASGYGTDHVSQAAGDRIRAALDADAEVKFMPSGTAANAFALTLLASPHEAVLAHEHAHICTDETGAPGFFGQGVGLIGLPGASGKIDPAALEAALAQPDVSYRQPAAALSLTTATEYGTVYSEAALKALVDPVKAKGYGVHLDGARLANAVAAGFDLKAVKRLGVDILVMGGTKAGSTPTEAVVFLNPDHRRRLDARIKHAGQLVSKGRFLAAPWLGLLDETGGTGPWAARAAHANAMAQKLAALMPYPILHPVEANGLFVDMSDAALDRLRGEGWFVYRFLDGSARFMCSWATTSEMVEQLGAALAKIALDEPA
ncbi:threonine aldolase [Caulobacter sp. D4A]|uniref:beta-eliminating lyase-related protein n=1 Tax=unclassified Caulobacter TaxID=2648921 RepID=UPI000D737702|nr:MULTISPECIES: low specificity L-threonine aldolase [unclassified Caulobacter]PXA85651.1 threonine aldolase [Caulobacter sp. D4A]PXA95216.1 threonine aldolase [Caulobacter sp. D5]